MDRERLARLLEEPSRVAREDLADLRAMAERFPWFSGAQLLLAVGEHASGDMRFDERLQATAAHLPSRAMLFDAVHAPPPPPLTIVRDEPVRPATERTTIVPPPRTAAPPPPSAPIPVEARVPEATPAPAPSPEMVPVADTDVAEPAIALSIVPAEAGPIAGPVLDKGPEEEPAPEEVALPAEPLPADPLDLQIRQAAVASGYDLTRLASAPPLPAAPLPLAPLPAAAAPLAPAPVAEPATAASRPPSITMATRLRFTDWLDQAGPEDVPALPPPSVPTEPSVMDWLRAEGPAEPAMPQVPGPPGDNAKDIIDRFIQGTMPAPAKKAEFFTPQQAAKRSLEDDGLVSETLARIHAKQGNIAKAIEAYQRLALKHPEKSAYFAALSKALEGGSNK